MLYAKLNALSTPENSSVMGIAEDLSHSQKEKRYYCFGFNREGNGILTVRFTYRSGRIRIIGAGYWRKGKKVYEQANSV